MSRSSSAAALPIPCPYTIAIDTREQAPFAFTGLRADSDQKHKPLMIETIRATLPTGDYSIVGYEPVGAAAQRNPAICVERKSLDDLFGSVGAGHNRFRREHERMAEIIAAGGYAAVVIEADWGTILAHPPVERKVLPKVVLRTGLAWSQKYGVQWWPMPTRRIAEITCFRMLEKFWGRMVKREREKQRQQQQQKEKEQEFSLW